MALKQFEEKVKMAENDSLIRALIEQAKQMDDDLKSYEAVRIIKEELLNRLEGEVVEEKKWRENLSEDEVIKVFELYQNDMSISQIYKELDDENLTQKAIRKTVAEKYGEAKECTFCKEQTLHVAFVKDGKLSCCNCGTMKQ